MSFPRLDHSSGLTMVSRHCCNSTTAQQMGKTETRAEDYDDAQKRSSRRLEDPGRGLQVRQGEAGFPSEKTAQVYQRIGFCQQKIQRP